MSLQLVPQITKDFMSSLWRSERFVRIITFISSKKCLIIVQVSIIAITSLYIKWLRDRRIKIICKGTFNNNQILRSLKEKLTSYNPTFWMFSTYIKTLISNRGRASSIERFTRKELELWDGEIIAIDHYPRTTDELPPGTTTMLIVPGLLGSTYDQYVIDFCTDLHNKLGWRCCVFNRRGYGGMPYRVD